VTSTDVAISRPNGRLAESGGADIFSPTQHFQCRRPAGGGPSVSRPTVDVPVQTKRRCWYPGVGTSGGASMATIPKNKLGIEDFAAWQKTFGMPKKPTLDSMSAEIVRGARWA
jgi:hypothetical protein